MYKVNISLPSLKGDVYLHYDKAQNVDYMFEYLFNYEYHSGIKSFTMLSSKSPDFIVLPPFNNQTPLPHDDFLRKRHIAEGEFVALNNSLKSVGNANLVIPGASSLKLSNCCFGYGTNINLILSKNRALFKVDKVILDDPSQNRSWYLIANKDFSCYIKANGVKLTATKTSHIITKNNASISVNQELYYDAKSSAILSRCQQQESEPT